MKQPKKFTFTFNGVKFTLPGKFYICTDWNGNPIETPYINVNRVAAATMVKQYVKSKYPQVVCSATSDSYSGGSSTNVFLSDRYGKSVDEKIYEDINEFTNLFQMGTFNGMIDMYEHNDNEYQTENGTPIKPSVKFVFVNNRASFESTQGICNNILQTMKGGKYSNQEDRPYSLEETVEFLKVYYTNEKKLKKAIELVKEVS